MQPGDTITPGGAPSSPDNPNPQTTPSVPPQPEWRYTENEQTNENPTSSMPTTSISWTASEFVNHEKGIGWFAILGAGTGLAAIASYFLTKDVITTAMIVIVAVLFGVFAVRRPRVLHYVLDARGVVIENKQYPYGVFKSFSIVEEDAMGSIILVPLRRFMPLISIYYPPDQANRVTDTLSLYLPYEQRERDVVDRVMRRLRF